MTRRPLFTWSRWLQWGFLTLGILALGLWSRTEVVAHTFQASESTRLEASRSRLDSKRPVAAARSRAALRARSTGVQKGQRAVLGRLEIPRLRIAAIVAEGVDTKTLGRAIGHVPTTARPGASGNCALAGHRDTFLRGLGAIRVDDFIRIVTPEHTFLYRVKWTEVVEPRHVAVLDPTPERSLTLITCYPFVYIGHAPRRFIVRAKQVDADEEAESARETNRPQERPTGERDRAGLPPLER